MSKNYSCGTLLKQIYDIMEKNAKTASFKELEKNFGVSQPTMVGILNRLVQKDFVEVLTDSEDKRIRK